MGDSQPIGRCAPTNSSRSVPASKTPLALAATGGKAPSREQVEQFSEFVEQQSQLGHAVAVHCTSGRRRTGTLLAAYLVRSGLSAEAAIQTILSANPQVELRAAQIDFLQALATA